MPVEEPPFRIQLRDGPFDVRDYPALAVAEVTVTGDLNHAAGQGFRILAGYIFGANARRDKIAMTAPVTLMAADRNARLPTALVEAGGAGRWVVRFTMPRAYALEALPAPKDARIRVRVTPPTQTAVVRFSGVAHAKDFEAEAHVLSAWMARRALQPGGPAALAQYDPPWTLWFLRRNEVLIPLVG